MSDADKKFMRQALELAKRGIGSVEPNPAVGCVIVKDGKIIGTGWHKKFGGPHAEINAIEDCRRQGQSPQASTMYVTLEPCCHRGKTSPCTDAIIAAKPAKVVVAMTDPSEHAAAKGIEQLRKAGIEVQIGVCETEAKLLNAPFIKFATTGKSWVILKWAQSADGKMAFADKATGRWISNESSREDVHKLRRRCQVILAGIETVLADDPLLTARPGRERPITRIVLDSNLRIRLDCQLLNTASEAPVLIVTSQKAVEASQQKQEQIIQKGADVLTVPMRQGRCDLIFLLEQLSNRSVQQLLVEGGPEVITSFLEQNLADQVYIYISPKTFGQRGSIDITAAMEKLKLGKGLHYVDKRHFGDDVRLTGLLNPKFIDYKPP